MKIRIKSVLNLVKLQSLVRNARKTDIMRGKLIPLSRKRYQFSVGNTEVYKTCKLYRSDFSHFTTFCNQTLQFY